ncbi:hypothetical protein H257_04159 [Aphanomyces astaci]|uniref:Uncharacterized protein n=1 Tax=Aphanomyces astaci TaxID=112090 RepID=W4GUR7_APHAT|nr:hypothetical protein H257_04159 [Aphanomyces astaci]ETV83432.1 hypothetical protein H257_04159 [Aphanomyces astaci]|eukprot:XP_009826862.1 hypothetical protein H257_04159 [Aphanomyces astaci]
MEKSIEINGSNEYKLPHMKKDAAIAYLAFFNVECDAANYEGPLIHLNNRLFQAESAMKMSHDHDLNILFGNYDFSTTCAWTHWAGAAVWAKRQAPICKMAQYNVHGVTRHRFGDGTQCVDDWNAFLAKGGRNRINEHSRGGGQAVSV